MHRLDCFKYLNSAVISDALDSLGIEGALPGIKPLILGMKLMGPAFTVKYALYEQKPTEFRSAADYIDEVPEDAVIMIDNAGRTDCTTWGDILTTVAMQKNIQGVIVNGVVRDVSAIREKKYPVFSLGTYMRSGKNRVYKTDQACNLEINGILIRHGDILFADDNGVIVIPIHAFDTVVYRARLITDTEQLIIESVKKGLPLADARRKYGYHEPWKKLGASYD